MKINNGEEDEMEIEGYVKVKSRQIITWILIILTVGILRLIFYWKPDWMTKAMCKKVNLEQAQYVILKDQYDQIFVQKIKTFDLDFDEPKLNQGDLCERRCDQKSDIVLSLGETEKIISSRTYFNNKKIKYVWNSKSNQFEKLRGFEDNKSCGYFHESEGLTQRTVIYRKTIYGTNFIELHVTPILKLIFTQVLHPFYIFQIFSCLIWFNDGYYYYATAIIVMSIISITAQIYQTRSMQRSLKKTLTPVNEVSVLRTDSEGFITILADDLVPGDVIEVPRYGCVMQCDAVLVSGNCIVNESMLTGESVPLTKTPIPFDPHSDIKFNLKEHSRHILFCGTKVIQTRYYGSQKVKAVVIRTGYTTSKGELVRSILYPKPIDFKFTQDGMKFIGSLAIVALAGMIYTWVLMIQRGDAAGDVIIRSLDLITIVVPPALPAAMTIGVVFAQKRLKSKKIFCINSKSINLCGAINVVCFDKTGTLTEDGLDLKVIQPSVNRRFTEAINSSTSLKYDDPMLVTMATCHSLTIIENELSGDPLDLKMFEDTNWTLEEPGEDTTKYDIVMPTVVRPKNVDSNTLSASSKTIPYEIGIIKQFVFSSKLQRMSVIARELTGNTFNLYAKGSPEMISSLSRPETVPQDFHTVLKSYTEHGYRVIALAWKPLHKINIVKVQRAAREDMECDLNFLGLAVMENRLKPQTVSVIKDLKAADIRVVMVTGDNLMTALSVARDSCFINRTDDVILLTALPPTSDQPARLEWNSISSEEQKYDKSAINLSNGITMYENKRVHFCITGTSWAVLRKYFSSMIPKLVTWGTVFARFSPEQKQQLVEELQNIDYYVGMCGDGANDCGALKSAHAGVSLSEAEASVASPFTSKDQHIGCVPTVIREGRAALVTSYGIFKFMACYSLTQFLSVCILYWFLMHHEASRQLIGYKQRKGVTGHLMMLIWAIIGANQTDGGFLYVDLFVLTPLCITFCYTGAYSYITLKAPQVSLIAVAPILSILLQLLVHLACQIAIWESTVKQPWLEPFIPNDEQDYQYQQVSTLILTSTYQYIIMAVVFAKGSPYRASMFSNYIFIINIVLILGFNLYMTMYPAEWLTEIMQLSMPPTLVYRGLMVALAGINFFLCFIMEELVVTLLVERRCVTPYNERHAAKSLRHRQLDEEMREHPGDWMTEKQGAGVLEVLMAEGLAHSKATDTELLVERGSRKSSEHRSSTGYESDNIDLEENDNYGRPLTSIMADQNRHDRPHSKAPVTVTQINYDETTSL